ncbi:EndoU domain-containing protein [Actinophytocola sp.]|uniref:EndoU domain-containing protein n=1 Tax=Actinophytocola sp. TaxID=1872138 RepID=UPI002ED664E8
MAGERGPKELIPGNPERIWEMADSLTTMGAAFEDIGRGFLNIDDGGWRGTAADAFHGHFARQPRRFLSAADAFGTAAVALDDYASALNWAQRQATEAIAMARQATSPAIPPQPPLTLAQQVEQTGVLTTNGEEPRVDPRTSAADDTLNRARDQVEQIGRDAAHKLREAGALAPRRLWQPPVVPAVEAVRRDTGSLIRLSVAKHSVLDVAANHPDARFKSFLDHETLRDRTHDWDAGVAELRKRLRRLGLDQLSPRLRQHIFEGHLKKRKRGNGYRELGYHHRQDGVDRGPMRVARVVAGPDSDGVYQARVAGPWTEGSSEVRRCTFFPDAWTRRDVLRAVRFAFLNRNHCDGRKWRGRARGLLIEGYVECRHTEPPVEAGSARLYHIVTAYPVYKGGGRA